MRNLAVFLGLFTVFHIVFWQQGMGVNLPLFVAASAMALAIRQRNNGLNINWFLLGCTLVSSVAVVWVSSALAVVALVLSAIAFLGSLHRPTVDFIEALPNAWYNFFSIKEGVVPGFKPSTGFAKKRGLVYMRIASIPLIILFVYILLFSAGNAIFNDLTGDFLKKLSDALSKFSLPHVAFIVLGIFVCRWVLKTEWAEPIKLTIHNKLQRVKGAPNQKPKLALKHEYLRALVLFGSLNVLFAVVNFIDVKWVWFKFSVTDGFNLKAFVHEGTGFLLITLLLSIGLILFFFRKNLNFYPKNKVLKALAYAWIVQNAVLAVSVIIRTSYYINFHGLASKRIALLVFISMVLFGLVTLMIKIAQQKNFAFVVRTNSAYIIGAVVLCACIPWSTTIAKHNLSHHNPHEIDVDNYLQLGSSVYPLLYENLATIEGQIEAHKTNEVRWIRTTDIEVFKDRLDQNREYFLEREAKQKVWSWNAADARTESALAGL